MHARQPSRRRAADPLFESSFHFQVGADLVRLLRGSRFLRADAVFCVPAPLRRLRLLSGRGPGPDSPPDIPPAMQEQGRADT